MADCFAALFQKQKSIHAQDEYPSHGKKVLALPSVKRGLFYVANSCMNA